MAEKESKKRKAEASGKQTKADMQYDLGECYNDLFSVAEWMEEGKADLCLDDLIRVRDTARAIIQTATEILGKIDPNGHK
jgi:hypothetical protein